MVHTASLVHDDIVDKANLRRSKASLNILFGNKVAAMTGNYLISSAAKAISHLQNPAVIKILSNIFSDLVSGELLQMKRPINLLDEESFKTYLEKTYLKTASLIAHGCKAVSYISHSSTLINEDCFNFGKNIGLAFQLVDDALDYKYHNENIENYGKPVGLDLKAGHITAPYLFSARSSPELVEIFERNFSSSGDVERAILLVKQEDGINKTLSLASKYTEISMNHLERLGWTPYHLALQNICEFVVNRKH